MAYVSYFEAFEIGGKGGSMKGLSYGWGVRVRIFFLILRKHFIYI
jgi:hypothetical protein